MAPNKNRIQDPAIKELDAIKRLLILMLLKSGTSKKEIASALNMDPSDFTRMFPARKIKRFTTQESDE